MVVTLAVRRWRGKDNEGSTSFSFLIMSPFFTFKLQSIANNKI
jgi:hypothetical protein